MKVSVVVPVYNQEMYLRECLNSLVEQDCDDYEVILVDDGSTDHSAQICQEYVSKYHHFQYIYQDNMGAGEARNTGLRYASGTYILFMDSDDVIQKNSIRKLFLFAVQNKADLVYFDEIICDENLEVLSIYRTYSEMDSRILKLKALEQSTDPAHVWARLYHRDLFNNICFENIWYADLEIFPRLLMKANSLYYYKVPIYFYRQHKKMMTHQKSDKRSLGVIKAWSSVYANAAHTDKERMAVELAIKKSICIFLFAHPQFAEAHVEFYNHTFKKEVNASIGEKEIVNFDISRMPLWQQADFYEQTHILKALTALQKAYQCGGVLQFSEKGEVSFQEIPVIEETLVLYTETDNLLIREARFQRGNGAILEVLQELSEWNLISLKNQMKEIRIMKKIIEKAILNEIRIEVNNKK